MRRFPVSYLQGCIRIGPAIKGFGGQRRRSREEAAVWPALCYCDGAFGSKPWQGNSRRVPVTTTSLVVVGGSDEGAAPRPSELDARGGARRAGVATRGERAVGALGRAGAQPGALGRCGSAVGAHSLRGPGAGVSWLSLGLWQAGTAADQTAEQTAEARRWEKTTTASSRAGAARREQTQSGPTPSCCATLLSAVPRHCTARRPSGPGRIRLPRLHVSWAHSGWERPRFSTTKLSCIVLCSFTTRGRRRALRQAPAAHPRAACVHPRTLQTLPRPEHGHVAARSYVLW